MVGPTCAILLLGATAPINRPTACVTRHVARTTAKNEEKVVIEGDRPAMK